MSEQLKKFLTFKLNQHCNITGKAGNTKEELSIIVKENMEPWVREAVAAGIQG